MDEVDRKILNQIQSDFPIDVNPYVIIGEKIGIGAQEAFARVRALRESGIIRRIGAIFDRSNIGFAGTLCAARVPDEQVADFVSVVNACTGVTHNYRRNNEYNIWFTLIAPSMEDIERIIARIGEETGISDILNMPAVRTYKIKATFEL